MRKTVEIFRVPLEVETRPKFDIDCRITEDNFVDIVGRIQFRPDDRVQCQIRKQNGNRCGKRHGLGWLAINDKDQEGYVGGYCANDHFLDTTKFLNAVDVATEQLAINDLLADIASKLAEHPDMKGDVERIRRGMSDAGRKVKELEEAMPEPLLRKLRDMARSMSSDVSVDFRHIKKDEKGRNVVERRRTRVGTIRGVSLLRELPSPFYGTLVSVSRCIDELALDGSAGLSQLSNWADELAKYPRLVTEAEKREKQVKRLLSVSNLNLLLLITDDQKRQDAVIRFILSNKVKRQIDGNDCAEYLAEYETRVRALDGDRDFDRVHH